MPGLAYSASEIRDALYRPEDPITVLPGIGPKRAQAYSDVGIESVGDLVRQIPTRYEDRSMATPIGDVVEGKRQTVVGTLTRIRALRLRGGKSLAEGRIEDDTGSIKVTWFGRGYLAKSLKPGSTLVCTGMVANRRGLAMGNPEFELTDGDDAGSGLRIVPRYRTPEGVSETQFRALISEALEGLDSLKDPIPDDVRNARSLPKLNDTLRDLHSPDEVTRAEQARERFQFERQFLLQIELLRERERARSAKGIAHPIEGRYVSALRESLPFALTAGQEAAVREILGDMASGQPMTRLIQGDVGSGKTAVAALAIAACLDSGLQAALMAPTEVLATQHYRTLSSYLNPIGVSPVLVTGSSRASERRSAHEAPVVIGTHAIAEAGFAFSTLGLVVVDEQHRFGVEQRQRLAAKGWMPDVLHMTATPIPRTLCLTLYGAMDLTIIPDRPPGRRPVETTRVSVEREPHMWTRIVEEAKRGLQTFVVCPLVEDTGSGRASASARYEELANGPLRDLRCGLLHGRLNAEEKRVLLDAFRGGAIDVLIATTVIEVGVDAPNACIIVIEDASSFGLSQLHQLRGRVGRNDRVSFCYLLGEPATDEGAERLRVLCETDDGFAVAEADFKLRGPGQMRGTKQTGMIGIDGSADAAYITAVRRDASRWLQCDSDLSLPASAGLRRTLADRAANTS